MQLFLYVDKRGVLQQEYSQSPILPSPHFQCIVKQQEMMKISGCPTYPKYEYTVIISISFANRESQQQNQFNFVTITIHCQEKVTVWHTLQGIVIWPMYSGRRHVNYMEKWEGKVKGILFTRGLLTGDIWTVSAT